MLPRRLISRTTIPQQRQFRRRLQQMANHTASNGTAHSEGCSLADLPKSNVFTSSLPPDQAFPTPLDSHQAPRQKLGPRMVRNALYTYVRPVEAETPELLAVSPAALKDIGLSQEAAESAELAEVVAGNKIYWSEDSSDSSNKKGTGIYPWAQCYGGFQFGQWAGQLGDGRAISLFESTNPTTNVRYEWQLKGAGKTPYSRFADGRAVLRSSIREFVVSEYLNAIGIPSTRALSLTLLPEVEVVRERIEPGAIVCRFAQSWLRIGTFDLMRSRGDRALIRQTATYIAENVYGGWDKLPSRLENFSASDPSTFLSPSTGIPASELQGSDEYAENRFSRLFRAIVRNNAKTVAAWQAYGFMNGVLNTDNTSLLGLSLDFGPFAFLDNFDPSHTPNHDDHMLRYAYRAQPSIIWWNLVRLAESIGELIGAGDRIDDEVFVNKGVEEAFAPVLIKRAETIIDAAGEEYKAVFLAEYQRLMAKRLGLKTQRKEDFDSLLSDLLDSMEALELDFNHFFRRLSTIKLAQLETKDGREETTRIFAHSEGVTGLNQDESTLKEKIAPWLERWRARVLEDWGQDSTATDEERIAAMKKANPNFVPRNWLLDEIIERVEKKKDRKILDTVMNMALSPCEDAWGKDETLEKRFVGDVPRWKRSVQCSCSS